MADSQSEDKQDAPSLVHWANAKINQYKASSGDWREQAVEAYACVAGDQWDPSVRSELEADERPIFTFNRIAGFLRGICGLETASRNTVQLYGREISDSGAADVLNAAISYVRDGCDADDEESDAFKDMLICGLGWTETLYSTENDPDGCIEIERIDPLHMRWDQSARKRGLADSRWRSRRKWLPLSVIEDVWGKAKADEISAVLDADGEDLEEMSSLPHDATMARNYDSDNQGSTRRLNGVPVEQFQYIRTAKFMQVMNPFTGKQEELKQDDYNIMVKRLGDMGKMLVGRQVKHREYRQLIYCGSVQLEEGELPCMGFTFNVITGMRDRNNGIWYGFIRDLLDPQRWINKFFSSMADVVASQAKGGLLAEVDAFVSHANAEADWANPRSIVWLKRDGMNKIKERANAGVPAGLNQLLDFTVSSLPDVAGVNLEFLGMAGREQPGVLEHQRKQAAIATLAEFFNALRLYRKQQGRVLLQFIDEFISDGRLIRVVGGQNARYVPLVRQPGALKYDIVVDEAPTSPDQKDRTWGALMQLLPGAAAMGLPIPPDIIQYAPFPQALIDSWMEFSKQGTNGMPPEAKAQMQQMQQQLQALQQENDKLKIKEQQSMAKIQQDGQLGQMQMQQDGQQFMQQMQAEMQQMAMKLRAQQQEFMQELELKRQEMLMSAQLERERIASQQQIQQQQIKQSQQQQSTQ